MKTAVEWLVNELYTKIEMSGDGNLFDEILKQAKAIEIEQLKNAWDASDINMRNQFSNSAYKAITFNEWFKNK
jgi:hypothetical protein